MIKEFHYKGHHYKVVGIENMEKLTCQDLMVGDWFKAVDYNSPFRITAIYDDVVQTQADYQSEIDGNWYSEAEIKDLVPIPLTEDILVKNGFDCQYYDDGNSYWWAVFDGWFNINFDHSDCSEGEFRCVNFRDLVIKSVHQLQHLLRLAGVQKEIEL